MNPMYVDTARLLTQVAPLVFADGTFALKHEGITAGIRRAFVVYLVCHNRPVHEVLFPSMRDIGHEYERNFKGMTTEPVELDTLLAARERMVRELQTGLDADERRFLLSLVAGIGSQLGIRTVSRARRASAGLPWGVTGTMPT